MNKILSILFVSFYLAYSPVITAANACHDLGIIEITSLKEIADSKTPQTMYFFDIDDTLFDTPTMLGSKAWRRYIVSATKDDTTKNWHDILSLFIARNYPLETVETCTSRFVRELQMKGYPVFGLTARERKMWYDTPVNDIDLLTVTQLASLGIKFSHKYSESDLSNLTDDPAYFRGIFFADIEPKGQYLLKLFKNVSPLPKKVIFVDDKQSQVESVVEALQLLDISCECYLYTATDLKAATFDPLIANIQLYYFWMSDSKKILSDQEALLIAKQYPEKNAEYYLRAVLNNIKLNIK